MNTDPATALGVHHRRRLRELWRSAGWPFQDQIEIELLAAGLLTRERDALGRETVRVTDAGIALLAQTLQRNRAARDAHEALVARIAREMQRAGRVVWRGLSLRAKVGANLPEDTAPDERTDTGTAGAADDGRWVMAMPDVYSIRHTTVEDYLEPVVHEVKVRRADLLADLRNPAKGEAYRQIGGECWYVLKAGIGRPDEVPPVYGVIAAHDSGELEVLRPAPRRAMKLPFGIWMALARATPEPHDDDAQSPLV
ncbi:MAG: hypothetical protein HY855_13250 [Burkholderiales bacterium]|nr:hypothetical protein [Burkholderiales bacterium]